MRLLGIAESWIKDGYLVVKPIVSNPQLFLGVVVHDSQGHRIGKVSDVIGRTDDPRIVVKLDHRELGELIATRKERVYYTREKRARK